MAGEWKEINEICCNFVTDFFLNVGKAFEKNKANPSLVIVFPINLGMT